MQGTVKREQNRNFDKQRVNTRPRNVEIQYIMHKHKDGSVATAPRHECGHPDCAVKYPVTRSY